jgi:hypothetical protein
METVRSSRVVSGAAAGYTLRGRTQLRCECRSHLKVAHQEGSLVEPLPSEPAGHFRVALTGVARTARRHDIVERVSPATGDREDAVALQRFVGGAAVRTPSPSSSKLTHASSLRSCSTRPMRRRRRRAALALRLLLTATGAA